MLEMGRKGEGHRHELLLRWAGCCFSGGTKALLCNHLGVKSALCAGHNGAQKQGAGGPVGSVQTQLWAEPSPSGSIWALLTSVAVPAQLPPGCHTMRALSKSFVGTFRASFSRNLKYFIRPPSSAVFLWSHYIKRSWALLLNPSPWGATKDSSKSVWVLMHSWCSPNTEMFKFQTVPGKKRSKTCSHCDLYLPQLFTARLFQFRQTLL